MKKSNEKFIGLVGERKFNDRCRVNIEYEPYGCNLKKIVSVEFSFSSAEEADELRSVIRREYEETDLYSAKLYNFITAAINRAQLSYRRGGDFSAKATEFLGYAKVDGRGRVRMC